MFRTIFSVALIGAANAVSLHKGTEQKAPATALDVEEVLAKAQSGEYTTEDVENVMEHIDHHMKGKDITDAIDWAAEQGIGFEEVKAMIEGVEVSQAFDKHDIYDFAMEACCHFEATEEGLDEMLHYAGQKLGITAEQGQELLETAGDVFDISQEEFDQAVQDCFAVGAKCAAKNKEGGDKKEGEKREGEGKDAKKGKKAGKKAKKAAEGKDSGDAKKAAKKGAKKAKKAKKAAEKELAEEEEFQIEDLLEVDIEELTPEDVASFLEENGEALKAELEAKQEDVVAFVLEHKQKIEMWVAENMDELEDFAADLEELVGDIDWDAVKAEAEAYFAEGKAMLEEKAREAKGAAEEKVAEKKAEKAE